MLNNIIEKQERKSSQVLHDIKSPITTLLILLEMLQPGQIIEAADVMVLRQCVEEVRRLLV